uniref:HTH cro/C1-type domain-containing protein n=3 Tax=Vibrionaceae TaxID=641 RepID=A0A0H3ZJP4_9VIBR|nr:hypothetical protein [Vibrio tasmaniensis]AKN40811.1 hypothetical protein [Vibrio sp. 1F_189]
MQITSAKMLANALRDQRKAQQLTQTEAAKSVGVKQTTVSSFENAPEGKWQPLNIIIQSVRSILNESYSTKKNFATEPKIATYA